MAISAKATASTTTFMLAGAGMLIPNATKNKVIKKSFTVATLVMISVLEARLAMLAPAISAAMPGPTDMLKLRP